MKNILETLQNKLETRADIVSVVLIVLVGISGFGLGRMSVADYVEADSFIPSIQETLEPYEKNLTDTTTQEESVSGEVVGSKNGSKYHFPWCSGARRMNEENKIWFTSIQDAKDAGYTPAQNCKGLE